MKFIATINILLLLCSVGKGVAAPEEPFTPDQSTLGLWHFDQSEPDCVWSYTFGTERRDRGRGGVKLDEDYILYGYSYGNSGPEPLLYRIDWEGEIVWELILDFPRSVYLYQMMLNSQDQIVAVGRYDSGSREQLLILVIDADGDSLWSNTYGKPYEDRAFDVIQVEDGGYIAAGYTRANDDLEYDIELLRVDEDGDSLWLRQYDLGYSEECEGMIATSDGGYLIGGTIQFDRQDYYSQDGFLLKLDDEFEVEWSEVYGTHDVDVITELTQVGENFITAGYSDNAYWMQEVSSDDGEVIWSKVYPGATLTNVHQLLRTQDGGFAVAGASLADSSKYAMSLLKTDRNGENHYIYLWGGADHDYCYGAVQEPDASFTLFGSTQTYTEDSEDYWLLHTAPLLQPEVDISGNQNLGSFTLDAQLAETGKWSEAMLLEAGRGGGFVVQQSDVLCPANFTVEAWFLADIEAMDAGLIVGKILEYDYFSYALIADKINDELIFRLSGARDDHEIYTVVELDEEWHHIAGSYDGEWMRLILDGNLIAEQQLYDEISYDEGEFVVGTNDPVATGDLQFYGLIDEVRLSSEPYRYLDIKTPAEYPVAGKIELLSIHPNPANAAINIHYSHTMQEVVTIEIVDLQGRWIERLFRGELASGSHRLSWNADKIPSGNYFLRVSTEYGRIVKKVSILK